MGLGAPISLVKGCPRPERHRAQPRRIQDPPRRPRRPRRRGRPAIILLLLLIMMIITTIIFICIGRPAGPRVRAHPRGALGGNYIILSIIVLHHYVSFIWLSIILLYYITLYTMISYNHLSYTTCVTHVFSKLGEDCGKLRWSPTRWKHVKRTRPH